MHCDVTIVLRPADDNDPRRIRGFGATGETRHVSKVSQELGPKVPLPKTENSADLTHYFSGVATFCVKKSNIGGSTSGLNWLFTGEISQ